MMISNQSGISGTTGGCSVPIRVNRNTRTDPTMVNVAGIMFGPNEIGIIAGPCAVESKEQLIETAKKVRNSGGAVLRGGAFKPRSSPYSFQGLGEEGVKLLCEARKETGLPFVTEVMDTRQVEYIAEHADMLQVGSRNMHNYPLLKEVGMTKKPVLLKRGMMATIEELLHSAEYILNQGNDQVILCERGIRTFETSTRNTLDLNAVPMLKHLSHLPVIVDPSHGTGHRWMVPAMARAAIAAGADGLIMEIHYNPDKALCDGHQSLSPEEFDRLMNDLVKIARSIGREILLPQPSII
ncbi:MAG TPA: 3-deoxy-7-phosphoheptulonate synthase [Bacteroidales bacterium]|nr:3-deoxy-7-phosphoheptulonate synthase [Bacteroidales bacterium]HNR41670.1 3-deoxy-7-phosphoheptulonate synthase [Bacteroidales bacterium]HPM17923.1 3-deoxy-7-phosphoheptulonate synthase [Bacteroidales bacterium]HQG78596.1 3-deoxy-7-phosphoheptulonate synthase [Bacteroidales bacterium]